MERKEARQKGKRAETIAEMVNLALESTSELVANLNKARESRSVNQPVQPPSAHPSSDKSP
jgi:hypothetical protein